jgi:hypothetical protein
LDTKVGILKKTGGKTGATTYPIIASDGSIVQVTGKQYLDYFNEAKNNALGADKAKFEAVSRAATVLAQKQTGDLWKDIDGDKQANIIDSVGKATYGEDWPYIMGTKARPEPPTLNRGNTLGDSLSVNWDNVFGDTSATQ